MASTKPKMSSKSVYISDDVVEAIDTLARQSGRKVNDVMKDYLNRAVEDLEGVASKPMIVSVMSFKGGVAKTTTTVNLAVCLGEEGHKVLVIDLDGQGNASQAFKVYDPLAQEPCIADVLLSDARGNRKSLSEVKCETGYENVSIVPSSFRFSDADSRIRTEAATGADMRLLHAIEDLLETESYDYIIIDCPPALGLVVTNAINALDAGNANSMIVIPVKVDGYAIAGLSNTIGMIKTVARERRMNPRPWKILRTVCDRRTNAYKEGIKFIENSFKDAEFFATTISRSSSVVESTLTAVPIVTYQPSSKPAAEYRTFAQEIEDANVSQ